MSLTELRTVSEEEIREAAMRWAVDVDGHLSGQPGPGSERVFRWCAIHWFSFQNVLLSTPHPEPPFFEFLADFIRAGTREGVISSDGAVLCGTRGILLELVRK